MCVCVCSGSSNNNNNGDISGRGSRSDERNECEEDLQDQLDELEVFQSIYENDIVINKHSLLKSFHQMNIKVEVEIFF